MSRPQEEPYELKCSVTLELFKLPVRLADSQVYEESVWQKICETARASGNPIRSPLTNLEVSPEYRVADDVLAKVNAYKAKTSASPIFKRVHSVLEDLTLQQNIVKASTDMEPEEFLRAPTNVAFEMNLPYPDRICGGYRRLSLIGHFSRRTVFDEGAVWRRDMGRDELNFTVIIDPGGDVCLKKFNLDFATDPDGPVLYSAHTEKVVGIFELFLQRDVCLMKLFDGGLCRRLKARGHSSCFACFTESAVKQASAKQEEGVRDDEFYRLWEAAEAEKAETEAYWNQSW